MPDNGKDTRVLEVCAGGLTLPVKMTGKSAGSILAAAADLERW